MARPGPAAEGQAARPVRLLAIGDIAWDVVVRPAGDLVWGADVYGATDLFPGGSSANVAVWARRLGADVRLVGQVGDDRLGQLMRAHLEDESVASHVAVCSGAETTRIAIVIRPDGEHAFVTDHTHPLRLTANDLPLALLDHADVVFLNGYAVFMAGSAAFASGLLDEARRRGTAVAFDPSSFSLIARYGAARLLDEIGPLDLLIGNEEELRVLSGDRPIEWLLERAGVLAVKQGARGGMVLKGDPTRGGACVSRHAAPAVPVRVLDTTGAGDAFDAAFIVEFFAHGDAARALQAANLLGSRVAGRLGAQAQD